MQMKRLSPENSDITEADTVHLCGRQHGYGIVIGEIPAALSGSESVAWPQGTAEGSWETQGETRRSVGKRRAASETETRAGEDKPLKARNL